MRRCDEQLIGVVSLFIGIFVVKFQLVVLIFELLIVVIRGERHLFFFIVFVRIEVMARAALTVESGLFVILVIAADRSLQLDCLFELFESIQLHRSFSLTRRTLLNRSLRCHAFVACRLIPVFRNDERACRTAARF